jgi:hypothetical protein
VVFGGNLRSEISQAFDIKPINAKRKVVYLTGGHLEYEFACAIQRNVNPFQGFALSRGRTQALVAFGSYGRFGVHNESLTLIVKQRADVRG